jgi:hypothetical protein
MADSLKEHIENREAVKRLIRKSVTDVCSMGNNIFPSICRYGSRSVLDQENIIEKIFGLMTDETSPMSIDVAFSTVDNSYNE